MESLCFNLALEVSSNDVKLRTSDLCSGQASFTEVATKHPYVLSDMLVRRTFHALSEYVFNLMSMLAMVSCAVFCSMFIAAIFAAFSSAL